MKDVIFMITESWEDVPKNVIMSYCQHLFRSLDDLLFYLPLNHFNADDDISLINLYRRVIPNSSNTDHDIINWSLGIEEIAQFPTVTDEAVGEVNNITLNRELPITSDINQVVNSFNITVQWEEESNLSYTEIVLLRRLREKTIYEKFQ